MLWKTEFEAFSDNSSSFFRELIYTLLCEYFMRYPSITQIVTLFWPHENVTIMSADSILDQIFEL